MVNIHLLHIPKTGGLTLHRALQRAGVPVTRSHDPAQVPGDAQLVVTLLRDPVDRVVSVYRHQRRNGRFAGTLREFLSAPADPWWWGVADVQWRYFDVVDPLATVDRPVYVGRIQDVAGILYEMGWLLYRRTLFWDYQRHNVAPPDDVVVTDADRDAIRAVNRKDLELWEAWA